jgi:hypothetical protein
MAFDITTSKPIENDGFNINTAKPIEEVTPQDSFIKNFGSDLLNNVKAPYDLGKNIIPLIKNLKDKYEDQQSVMNNPIQNVIEGSKASIVPLAEDIGSNMETMVTNPGKYPVSDAMMALPLVGALKSILTSGAKGISKAAAESVAEGAKKESGIPVANIIAGGTQPSNILAIANNPELAARVHAGMGLQVEGENGLLSQAADALKNAHDNIKTAQSEFYKKAGITDETPTVWNKPILGDLQADGTSAEPITPIDAMRGAVMKYREMATSDEMPIADKADELIDKIIRDSDFKSKENAPQDPLSQEALKYKTAEEFVNNQKIPKPILSVKELEGIAQTSDNAGYVLSLPEKKELFTDTVNSLREKGIKSIDAYHITNADEAVLNKEGIKGSKLDYIGGTNGNLREKSSYVFLDPDDIAKGQDYIQTVAGGNPVVHIKIPIEELHKLNWDSNFNLTAGTYSSERFTGDIPKEWIQSVSKPKSQLTDIWNKAHAGQNTSGSDMTLPFGKAKAYSQKFFDLAQSNEDNPGAQRLFNQMYQVAKGAKNSIPEIANASDSFKDLANAKDLMEANFPMLGTDKDFMVDKKLLRTYKDNGNLAFRQNLDSAADILSKYPESAPLSDFTNKMQNLRIGLDMEKGKAASPFADQAGVKSVPGVGMIANMLTMKPSTKLPLVANGVRNGWLSKAGIESTVQPSHAPFVAPLINSIKAYSKALQIPKPNITLPTIGTGAASIMSIGNLTNNNLTDTVKKLITK